MPDSDAPIESPSPPPDPAFRPVGLAPRLAVPIAGTGAVIIEMKPAGTLVNRGDVLVERWPELTAAPLAPVDGRIIGSGTARLSERTGVPAVIFEPAATARVPQPTAPADPAMIGDMLRRLRGTDLPALIAQLRKNGVWADRWSSPDLFGQLAQCLAKPIDTVLCNVLDDSPDLLLHGKIAATCAVELAAGVLALAAVTGAEQVWAVAAAFGDSDCWEALRGAVAGAPRFKLVPLRDHYPQSHPSLLIHELTGRHSRPVHLPTESGVLVLDAAAAVAVGRCLLFDEPMLSIYAGLHDTRLDKTHWLSVPVGTPWSQAMASCAIPLPGLELRAGNPLREWRLRHDCIIAGSELSAAAGAFQSFVMPDPCIRCAWCVEGCPVRIQPAGLLEAAQQNDSYLADQYGLDACIECGICTYVCPSNLPILAGIRSLRAEQARDRDKRR